MEKAQTDNFEGMGVDAEATLFGQTLKREAELYGGACENMDGEGLKLMIPTFEFIPIRGGAGNPR